MRRMRNMGRIGTIVGVGTLLVWGLAVPSTLAQTPGASVQEPFAPQVGQPGKDVVWVPTPSELVETMLDLAQVTSKDLVVDLGSGDGRNVIAAAKRGAKGRGVEFNPDMVALSRRSAAEAGVGDRAKFVQGDMFEADFSDATVLALFLLPSNMRQLQPKFFAMKPGTRIVANTFGMDGWEPDERVSIEGECMAWCAAMLWIVPAKVDGKWRLRGGELALKQSYQNVTGTLTRNGQTSDITQGKLRGEQIVFTVDGVRYAGRVRGDRLEVDAGDGAERDTWRATRVAD